MAPGKGDDHRISTRGHAMVSDIRITLFGRFSVQYRGEPVLDHAPHKVRELLAYLLLNPGRPHPREALADLLWEECESPHAKKYLRQALWQLHAGLLAIGRARASRLIRQEPGWVELDLNGCAWVDTVTLEEAFLSVRGRTEIQPASVKCLVDAVQLYRGDLLEGWTLRWCSYERYRFREMYLTLLDKLVSHYESRGDFEAGIAFSMLALQCDRARERTHRHMMRLQFLSGDRTGALRQYERCVSALRDELEIAPSLETIELHRAIATGASIHRGTNGARKRVPASVPRVGLALAPGPKRSPARGPLASGDLPELRTRSLPNFRKTPPKTFP